MIPLGNKSRGGFVFNNLDAGWKEVLREELSKPYISNLCDFLSKERGAVYPPREEIFEAFRLTSYKNVKAVILGQDPYHGRGQAHGLCFSVKKGVKIPPSLKNIYKELQEDLGAPEPSSGCLEQWAKKGVLLLNTTLTVREGEANSHQNKGWELFTDAVLSRLCEKQDPLVFILWGNSAIKKCKTVLHGPHLILTAGHPSPLSWKKFKGCKHFSKANAFLKEPIDWSLD